MWMWSIIKIVIGIILISSIAHEWPMKDQTNLLALMEILVVYFIGTGIYGVYKFSNED